MPISVIENIPYKTNMSKELSDVSAPRPSQTDADRMTGSKTNTTNESKMDIELACL